jgi:galactose mutarotase-like enzyme
MDISKIITDGVTMENEHLKVTIKEKGAELNSVINKTTGLEYMWSGDPAFWGKTSPILFPIVGTLKKDTYSYKDKLYSLSRHGFAREATFQITTQREDSVIFSLSSTPASLQKYPFDFKLTVEYRLIQNNLEVIYVVTNGGRDDLYFSIGGHPAFKVPLVEATAYEDHYLEFEQKENCGRWPISPEGLIEERAVPFLQNSSVLTLTRALFKDDALVFKDLKSKKISLKSGAHQHGLDFYFSDFPYLGIWAAKSADFVCIEPWCGIADSVLHDQQLVSKEGIVKISKDESWTRSWKVRPF